MGKPTTKQIDRQCKAILDRAKKAFAEAEIEVVKAWGGMVKGVGYMEPTIWFRSASGKGYKAVDVAIAYGLPVTKMQQSWEVVNGDMRGPFHEIIFRPTW